MDWWRNRPAVIAPALSALSTMALGPALAQLMAPADGVMWVSLCASDGTERTVAVALGSGGEEDDPMENCQIACHAICARKDQHKPGSKPKV